MDMLDKRLNDKGKNWRHVLKSLKVLDYCLHEGSELVVTWARKNVYIIKTLREFQYVDEDSRDVGQDGEQTICIPGFEFPTNAWHVSSSRCCERTYRAYLG
jgi:epsin